MSTCDSSSKRNTVSAHWQAGALCVVALILLAACGPAAPAAEPTATSAPPTATYIPPSATPIPPTPTPAPTATPELAPLPPDGRVVYNDPWGLIIRRPEVGAPPYPWVFVTTCWACSGLGCPGCGVDRYTDLSNAMLDMGYATAMVSTDALKGREFCAWAWLEENAAAYGLDTNRAIVFSHGFGLTAPLLGIADEALWAEMLGDCPYPAVSPVHIRGVATYSAWFMVPQGSLAHKHWPSSLAMMLNYSQDRIEVTKETVESLATVLQELPPAEWRTSDRLDDAMRFVAHRMPLYYIDGPKPADQMPAFLLTHGGRITPDMDFEQPIAESEMMAEELRKAGLSVETFWLPDAGYYDIMSADTGVPEQIAEAIGTWAQGLFEGD